MLFRTSFNRLRVVAGAHDISDEKEATQQVVNVKSVAVHPDYDSDTYLNDIALIVVSSPLKIHLITETTNPLISFLVN